MLRILGLIVVIALGDSLNPSTIAPALYVASGPRARIGLIEFTLAVFAVHFTGGALLIIGPGQLLLSLVNGLGHSIRDALEVAGGVAMLVAGTVMVRHRDRLSGRPLPEPAPKRTSRVLLGATIIALELPTAFPYFAALAAVLGSGGDLAQQLALVGIYNVCFVLPLLAILVTLLAAGDRADAVLTRGREVTQREWPVVLGALLALIGLVLIGTGVAGFVS